MHVSIFPQTVNFPQKFYETPTVITTPKHLKDGVNSLIDANNNAITEWIKVRTTKDELIFSAFEVTMYNKHQMTWIGVLEPRLSVNYSALLGFQ